MNKYDVIIIGGGLGGLTCGVTLSKEGYNVCVVEKNPLPGGCFQSFRRHGRILDTGIHYIGSLDKDEILHQYFTYFGIMNKLRLLRMDPDGFDMICYKNKEYAYSMGYTSFEEKLKSYFPKEKDGIRKYVDLLKTIGDTINIERLQEGKISTGGMNEFSVSAWEQISALTDNEDLRQVLSSPAMLYGGDKRTSTFYHHAMITTSYLQGAYRLVDGSMHLADVLVEEIKRNGGTVLTNSEVTRLYLSGNCIRSVEINGSEQLETRHVISSLHPAITMRLVEKTPLIRQAYLTRLSTLPNSYGLFSVYLLQKPGTTLYHNRNCFIYQKEDIWYTTLHPEDKTIHCALATMQPSSGDTGHTEVICLMAPMFYKEVSKWENTNVGNRGEDYMAFKDAKAQELIDFVERYYPGISSNTEFIHATTPLTYRDYTAIPEGSAYGIMKNYNNPLVTIIPNRTRIANLLLTGQNLNVHGALGVTLTSMLTCAELLGEEYLAKKVAKA